MENLNWKSIFETTVGTLIPLILVGIVQQFFAAFTDQSGSSLVFWIALAGLLVAVLLLTFISRTLRNFFALLGRWFVRNWQLAVGLAILSSVIYLAYALTNMILVIPVILGQAIAILLLAKPLHKRQTERASSGQEVDALRQKLIPLENAVDLEVMEEAPATEGTVTLYSLEWCEIPVGGAEIEDHKYFVGKFRIGKYPVTYRQFQEFVEASDGFSNDEWWEGLTSAEREPAEQWWRLDNHPRENVSWFDAIAFCRWKSSRLGYQVRLPKETEWQWAAQGDDGRPYPWGSDFDPALANTVESEIKSTTAVNHYPDGASPFGVVDMFGNVWEWCLNDHSSPEVLEIERVGHPVVRGGSWKDNPLSVTHRGRNKPEDRADTLGFRLATDIMSD